MPREIHLDQVSDTHTALQAAVAELEAGKLILVPDECGWNLMGLATREISAAALQKAAQTLSVLPVVSIAEAEVVADYVIDAPRLFQKLSARCWPGPVILRSGSKNVEGLARQWPESSRDWAMTADGRAYYCPADPFVAGLLRALSAPVLSALGTTDQKLENGKLDDIVSLKILPASRKFSEPPTVVAVQRNGHCIESAGVVSERRLARLAGEVYLFICTGNTCRSPMAEAIFRKMLADRLKCREDDLMDRGFVVVSAGLAAPRGAAASPEAVVLLREEGIDLSGHESQPVTEELLFRCDYIFAMTRNHREAVVSAFPELANNVRLLSPENEDVSDPIGAGMEEYARCRDEITGHLTHWLDQIEFPAH
ncbi:hypothetical protein [Planctomicrobium sp. SH664]|uniref:arsenate reductase/protein-tyrosine-phosphatase family protein n=1 Tax=Planctomicrobium sp. SH664 TaxID=3448125 RepID=UPI003F5AE19E